MIGKRRTARIRLPLLLMAGLLLLALGSLALAQGVGPQMSWWSVDGGGGTSTGETYTVSGTAGQPEAGGLSGDGHYTVTGGSWGAAAAPAAPPPPGGDDYLFLPVVRGP